MRISLCRFSFQSTKTNNSFDQIFSLVVVLHTPSWGLTLHKQSFRNWWYKQGLNSRGQHNSCNLPELTLHKSQFCSAPCGGLNLFLSTSLPSISTFVQLFIICFRLDFGNCSIHYPLALKIVYSPVSVSTSNSNSTS